MRMRFCTCHFNGPYEMVVGVRHIDRPSQVVDRKSTCERGWIEARVRVQGSGFRVRMKAVRVSGEGERVRVSGDGERVRVSG